MIDYIRRHFQVLRPEIVTLFRELWGDPEIAGLEIRSSARLADWLKNRGFSVTRRAGGIPTAFVARRNSGKGPRLAILAEYDALPGLANDAIPERRGRGGPGHACGHNHIGPANCAAAIIAAETMVELGLAGGIAVVGCPAEEILWGKIALLKQGVFDGFDAILTSHGDYQTGALSRPCMSAANGEYVYLGEAGHGGSAGIRNALSGAEAAQAAIAGLMAAQFPGCSIKHVLRRAGIMPSITPDEARLWCTIRHVDMAQVSRAYDAITGIAREIAIKLGLGFRHQHISQSRGYLPNDTLAQVLQDAIGAVPAERPQARAVKFMQSLAAACGDTGPLQIDLEPRLHTEGHDYYGQDDGEVSWRIPLARMNWAFPESVPIHHWAWTALSGHPAGDGGPLLAAQAIALAAVRLLAAPTHVAEARAELERRTAGVPLEAPWVGAWDTMLRSPESFWDASWSEVTPRP
ncbi:M20 family metallopeptidase [soil metagenome]